MDSQLVTLTSNPWRARLASTNFRPIPLISARARAKSPRQRAATPTVICA
jgi:hypothetical protein